MVMEAQGRRGGKLLLRLGLLAVLLLVALWSTRTLERDDSGPQRPSYVVVAGDSLSAIAGRKGCSVAQLRSWNGISGDLIEVGQQLWVGPAALQRDSSDVLLPVTASPPKRRSPTRARRPSAASTGSAGLDLPVQPAAVASEPSWPALTLPAARPCLAAETGADGGAIGRSQGLDGEQVAAAARAFQEQTLRCYRDWPRAEGEVQLRLLLGCNGRVRSSTVHRDGTGQAGFAACVAGAMAFAPFPVHARDEVEVVVPLYFVADTSSG